MADGISDDRIPYLLLIDLLALVARYIRHVPAAKEFLLDYFHCHEIDWQFVVKFDAVRAPGVRGPLPEISNLAVKLGFWRRSIAPPLSPIAHRSEYEDVQIDVDWE